ncbi:hypothetical protein [Blastococcus deserti]|uniref:Cobalt/nickel transport protein n=1 Tax=Blastococcus deserti TaxID=2259033 RepID=A0ABW4XDZ8_9ACTN
MTAAHRRVIIIGAVGFLLVVAGLATSLLASVEPVTAHTGGYAPCAETPSCADLPWTVGVTAAQLVGAGLVALGAVLVAGVAGWLWRDAAVGS